ncbi:MAG TPA: FKBP-type peptidyl-prolyl cis-trans isomerase [Puia sp.]|nr:FKBP-type peptidyl-prolyl cis-trans isomerase [Puia sp.]
MKKIILVIVCVTSLLYIISCAKSTPGYYSCEGVPASYDTATIALFAKQHGLTVIQDTSLIYYQIITQGSGATPTAKSKVTVNYVGTLLNGNQFDSVNAITFELDSVIKGWQYALPKIQTGGHIKFLVPSSLAFGCTGTPSIPANAPLFFDVQLLNVQ